MMICKVDWKQFHKKFIDNFIKSNSDINIDDVLFDDSNKSFLIKTNEITKVLGCLKCLDGKIDQDHYGDIKINDLTLINCRNFAIENNLKIGNDIAEEISNNIWICPNCKRWIFDFLPKFDTTLRPGY